jgi:hypothetical protein
MKACAETEHIWEVIIKINTTGQRNTSPLHNLTFKNGYNVCGKKWGRGKDKMKHL